MTVPPQAPPEESTAKIIRYTGRLVGLDLARAIAIFGMFWAHVSPYEEQSDIGFIVNEIPSGRSALLFALLAGVSLALMTGRTVAYTGTDMLVAKLRIVGRAVGLFLIATILELFDHPVAVILGFYALWFLIGLFFVHKTVRFLLISGFSFALIGPNLAVVLQTLVIHFSIVGGYAPNDLINSGFITGMYPGLAYFPVVIVGMGLGRLDLRNAQLQLRWLVFGALLASISYAAAWGLNMMFPPEEPQIADIQPLTASEEASNLRDFYSSQLAIINQLLPKTPTLSTDEFWQLMSAMEAGTSSGLVDMSESEGLSFTVTQFITLEPHSNTTFEIMGALGVGITIIMACMMLTCIKSARTIVWPVIAAGTMPLTVYSAHIVAFGLTGDYLQSSGGVGVAWLVLPALVFAPLWLWKFKRGPLEWCLYRLSTAIARS